MPVISSLLCVVDPTVDHQLALQRAAWVARSSSAELELMTCDYNQNLPGNVFLDAPSLQDAWTEATHGQEGRLEALADPLRNEGLVVKTTAIYDHPLFAAVIRQVARSGADIVLGFAPPSGHFRGSVCPYRLESHSHLSGASVAGQASSH